MEKQWLSLLNWMPAGEASFTEHSVATMEPFCNNVGRQM